MKRLVLCIFLFGISFILFSQEINDVFDTFAYPDTLEIQSYNRVETDVNTSLRFIFPTPDIAAFSFVDFSAGIGFGIIPGYWYIGAAADAAIGLDWFAMFSDEEDDFDREYNQFAISLGARIYNSIRLADLQLKPFFGCDFLFILLPMLYAGMEISIKSVGLEYAYYFDMGDGNPIRHQVSLKLHIPLNEVF
jgi:hypothetical protein